MARKAATSILNRPGIAQFCENLVRLNSSLQAIRTFRNQRPRKAADRSNHSRLKDKELHLEAQKIADIVSADLEPLLHPGLGFQKWRFKVKAGAQVLRWAPKGSGGRGGHDVTASFDRELIAELCSWVAASAALPDVAPEELAQMTVCDLSPKEMNHFRIRADERSFEIAAPTPTLAYIKGGILCQVPRFHGLRSAGAIKLSDSPKKVLTEYFRLFQKDLRDFPKRDGLVGWSAFPELKSRIVSRQDMCGASGRKLEHTHGQLSEETRTLLAAIALKLARKVDEEIEGASSPLKPRPWLVTCGMPNANAPAGQAFVARTPNEAMMIAAVSMLECGPYPAPLEDWKVYPIGEVSEPSSDASVKEMQEIVIQPMGWGGK